jgi:hypothetical protein
MEKAQSTLEFTLAFIIMVALIGGLLKIWSWSNAKIGLGGYGGQRVHAGSLESPGDPLGGGGGGGTINDNQTFVSW